MSDVKIESIAAANLPDADLLASAILTLAVWPSESATPEQCAVSYRNCRDKGWFAARGESWHLIRDPQGSGFLGRATTFLREIEFEDGRRETILALAGVCTRENTRGQGLGARLVRAAFERVAAENLFASLFQTSEPRINFYTRLGATLVDNPCVNSLADDPTARPWWDPVVMRYPADGEWPEGTIDLLGEAY